MISRSQESLGKRFNDSCFRAFEADRLAPPALAKTSGHNVAFLTQIVDLFRLCPPSLVGAYYLQPPDARAIFLHNDLLCNDTCSVTGGSITYWGGTNGKDPK